jgi:hypothetical protein
MTSRWLHASCASNQRGSASRSRSFALAQTTCDVASPLACGGGVVPTIGVRRLASADRGYLVSSVPVFPPSREPPSYLFLGGPQRGAQ